MIKKSGKASNFWLALTLFSLIGQIAWVVENMYLNVFIYKMFNASAADISLMVSASAVSATLTTVLIGALTDKVGKRKAFICGGYIVWGLSIFGFALLRKDVISSVFPAAASVSAIGVTLVIVLDVIMTFFGSSANDAAFNAWLTDSTDDSNRGKAEGINAMMPLVAILAVFGGFMAFDLNKSESWTAIFVIIGAITLAIGVIGIFIIKDPAISPSKESYFESIIYGFRPSTVKSNVILYLVLAAFIVFNISIQIFMPYLILYYEVSLQMADYVLVMAPAIVIASVITAFFGRLYDAKGFKLTSLISLVSLCAGYVILFFFRAKLPVFIGSLLMMTGYLCGMAVFGAKIRDRIPHGKAGMLQGARIFSQVLIPGIVGPFIGKTVLKNAETVIGNDGTESFVPNSNIFLAALIVAGVLAVVMAFCFTRKSKAPLKALKTPYEDSVGDIPFSDYPRPMMKRDSYICLNGKWDLRIYGKKGLKKETQITVPFAPQSKLSGAEYETDVKDLLEYSRSFRVDQSFIKDTVLLHFGAVDGVSEVFVNGASVCKNSNGYLPFCVDITKALAEGENVLTVKVKDKMDKAYPYGKQRLKRGGMWYTPVSGIWQTVWLESVPKTYIKALKCECGIDECRIVVEGGEERKRITVSEGQGERTYDFSGSEFVFRPENPHLWSPDDPYLYRFTLESGSDKISSYFAMRSVDIKKEGELYAIRLNGSPYFFHGLLDQGYFSDGLYLPGTSDGYKDDILRAKEMGFNMLRKHIKIEPDIFYYYCDLYGMIVFQDLVNSGPYNFIIDTALPTLFLKKGVSHPPSKKRRQIFEQSAKETVELLFSHPCVCYYTIFNEGWGQYEGDRIYREMKKLDGSRIWDTASGWFKTRESDVQSDHIYFKPVKCVPKEKRPVVLSEFGGYSYKIEGHCANTENTYGYSSCSDENEYIGALEALYCGEVKKAIENGLCAAVFTQLTDVEDETNGLITYDRCVIKVDTEKMKKISDTLYRTFENTFKR